MSRLTITSIASKIPTEADAYLYLEGLRWGNNPLCSYCDSEDVYLIVPKNGISRSTRTGSQSQRRVWRCRTCNKQFSILTNTIMHGTKVAIRMWILVIFEMCSSKNGVSAREIERKYGVCPRTAWFLLHKIREAMKGDSLVKKMKGAIISDETWIGGNPKNKHYFKEPEPIKLVSGEAIPNQKTDKTPVLSLINVETGEVRSKVIADVTGATLSKIINENISVQDSSLQTDEGSWYRALGSEFQSHNTVNHSKGEYVRDGITTNHVEGYFSQLKRSLDGTHHHVSKVHLNRYLAEFDFRYSTSKLSDEFRIIKLMGQVETRLTYKQLKS